MQKTSTGPDKFNVNNGANQIDRIAQRPNNNRVQIYRARKFFHIKDQSV